MLDKLIKKVIKDAENKASDIIENAEKDLEAKYLTESMVIEKEYKEKLQKEKNKTDREMELQISSFVMERERELLALKNSFIDEVLNKVEERFKDYLNKRMEELIVFVCNEIKEKEYIVQVPTEADIDIEGIKIEKNIKLKAAFIIVSPRWEIVFDWKSINASIGDILREKTAALLKDNGKTETS